MLAGQLVGGFCYAVMARVSKAGIEEVDRRRIKRGWSRKSTQFGCSPATLGRFWAGKDLKKATLIGIFEAVEIADWPKYLIEADDRPLAPLPGGGVGPASGVSSGANSLSDRKLWDGVPDYPIFYGRTKDRDLVTRWLCEERYRVVALLGFGGIGKTALTAQLAEHLAPHFEGVIWRSMRAAPSLTDFLIDLLETLSGETIEPKPIRRLIADLINRLNQNRILLVFDGWEELLGGDYGGIYRPEYQDYGTLLAELGQQKHQSGAIVTSREKQADLTLLSTGIRSFSLPPLETMDAFQLLNRKGLTHFDRTAAEQLVSHYRGNPLALQLVASKIRDQFDGDIRKYLQQDPVLAEDLFMRTVLEQQTRNLNPVERQMLCILAQDPEPIDREALGVRFTSRITTPISISEILASLERRSLIDRTTEAGQVLFSLQPVVRQYVQRYLCT